MPGKRRRLFEAGPGVEQSDYVTSRVVNWEIGLMEGKVREKDKVRGPAGTASESSVTAWQV